MKRLGVLLLMFVAINAIATDYVIVRQGNEPIVYELSVGYSGTVYMNTFHMKGANVDMLVQSGLPKELWGELSGPDGVFDSRLVSSNQALILANQQLDNDTEYIAEVESSVVVYKFFTGALSTINLIIWVLVSVFHKKRR